MSYSYFSSLVTGNMCQLEAANDDKREAITFFEVHFTVDFALDHLTV